MKNIDITPYELANIRTLGDFDLTMLLSDVHDHGWPMARKTLVFIMQAVQVRADVERDRSGGAQSPHV